MEQRVKERVENKLEMLRKMRQEIRQKDADVEFLEFVLREKQKKTISLKSKKGQDQ